MDLELRPVTVAEAPEFHRAVDAAFSGHLTDEDIEDDVKLFEPDRSLAWFDEGRIVGTAGAVLLNLTLPPTPGRPCPSVAAPGVGYVGVLPSHRRRGLLTGMMTRQLDDVAARGEPLAILTASEGAIYRRFGYGPASFSQELTIDTARARLAAGPADSGRMRLIDATEATKVLPELFDRVHRQTPGDINRPPAVWEKYFVDREHRRRGLSANWYVLHETGGAPDGYVRYRVKSGWDHGLATSTLHIMDFAATTPEVAMAQWGYVFGVDLMATIEWDNAPVDLALPFALTDLRQVRFSQGAADFVWVRLLDIPAALAARGYPVDGRLVFEVTDRFRPAVAGRYELVVAGGEGSCQRATGGDADLTLDVSDLGSTYLGGLRFSTLARVGRISGSGEALALADAMFASTPLPWCATGF